MTSPTDDQLDAYLRELPAPNPDPAAAIVARAQLERHLAAGRTALGTRVTRRRFTAFAGLATAGAAAAVLVLVGGGSGGRPDPAVAAEMNKIARAADARAADPVIGPGKAWYVRSILLSETTVALGQNAGLPGPSREVKYQQPELREAWFRPDAPGHLKTRYTGKIRMLAGSKESDIPPSILHDSQPTPQGDVLDPGIQIPFGGDLLTLEQSRELPTDPHELLSKIRDAAGDAGPDPDSEAFTVIGDALRETPIGRDLRVALLRTVGLIPGVSIRHGRDSKGRIAAIASHTNDGGRSELYLDPEDGTLLEERTVSTGKDGVAAGTVLYRSTLDVAGVVDGVGARPRR